MSAHVPALPLELDPLIAEAKQRARRRRLLAAGVLLAVGVVIAGALQFGAGKGSGDVPWLPTKPQLGAANPPLAPACSASQLRAKLELQGIGFGRSGGPLLLENRGSSPCSIVGTPKLSFADATSKWRLRHRGSFYGPSYDPLAPPQRSIRSLAPGRWAATYLTWANWCGRGSSSTGNLAGDHGRPPRALVLAAPGGGRIAIERDLSLSHLQTPACLAAGGSTLDASRFSPVIPQGSPSSALPLAARIVPTGHIRYPMDSRRYPVLAAHPGAWLSYTVVLRNRSSRPFSFGRTCPAYEEGLSRQAAYILNCRAVGTIAPHAGVRFAMRFFIPPHLKTGDANTLAWTLAPHSWNAPVTQITLQVR